MFLASSLLLLKEVHLLHLGFLHDDRVKINWDIREVSLLECSVAIDTVFLCCWKIFDIPPFAHGVKGLPLFVAYWILRIVIVAFIAGNLRFFGLIGHSEDIIIGLVTHVCFVPVYLVRFAVAIPSHPDVVTVVVFRHDIPRILGW